MQRAHLAGGALTLVAAVLAGPAHSAPACPMVSDPPGDASYTGTMSGPGPGRSFDIRSVDIGARRDMLIASVHVDQLRLADPHTAAGLRLDVYFRVRRHQFVMRAQTSASGQVFSLWAGPAPEEGAPPWSGRVRLVGPAEGRFDEDRSEIRIIAPLRKFAAYELLRPGRVVTHPYAQMLYGVSFKVETGQPYSPYGDSGFTTDHAMGDADYTIGGPSCVRY